ncbi:MAG: alpha-glucan family phosphorylase [Pirellulales bacterium]
MSTITEESLVLTAVEVGSLVTEDSHAADLLSRIVELVGKRFQADVCSVYLLEPDRAHLVLAATVGLRPSSVGRLRMGLNEGLAGLVAERLSPVVESRASVHPRFKYFDGSGEDAFQSFVGVPLIERGMLQGVLVVQTRESRTFTAGAVEALTDVAQQLGPAVTAARMLGQFIAPAQERLWAIARNLWWCWHTDGGQLFLELDPIRWRELDHNPVALLAEMPLRKLQERAGQLVLHSRINHVYHRLQEYLDTTQTWADTHCSILRSRPVAYFSAEFGLHESLPIYSGGLGVLAGDHIKSASDLGVPLVGVGLFYSQGYFHQRLDASRWQREDYIDVDTARLPLEPALTADGQPVSVSVETRSGVIHANVWQLQVGRCRLLLLDSNVPGNAAVDRELTARLYDGDSRTRIRQELLLGVGGIRALAAVGITPGVLHLNEGHSAFAPLEMVRRMMHEDGMSFDEASRLVARQSVFTTHTPVPAGHDRFAPDLTEEHLGPLRDALGISYEHLLSLGRVDSDNTSESFCMTVLALKMTRTANAVSSLHGYVSRSMWARLWPERDDNSVPIGHITNGVHVGSWLAPQMHIFYDRHLGTDWPLRSADPEVWKRIGQVNEGELWEAHLSLKSRLIDFVRRRVGHAVSSDELTGLDDSNGAETETTLSHRNGSDRSKSGSKLESPPLSPDTLTIGFARRFATYKRANLFLFDLPRLLDLVNDPQRPVQFIFAGKAHPRDEPGKTVLQQIAQLTSHPRLAGKILFVEDYDINIARHMVQGVDVWLNNPRRPLEASGTSGQKVVLNGGLNLSVLDGWWAEAYDGSNGFAIGDGRSHVSDAVQDARDAEALYQVLTEQVIPMYYHRDHHGLPRQWISYMKNAIATLGWRFNADRMVMDYVRNCYVPAVGGVSSQMPS